MTFASRIEASMGVVVSMMPSMPRRLGLRLLLLGECLAAAAAVRGLRVREEEFHGAHFLPHVELELIDVREARVVDEDAYTLALEGVILRLRGIDVEIEDVAELRAASLAPLGRDAEPERRLLGDVLLRLDLPEDLARGG